MVLVGGLNRGREGRASTASGCATSEGTCMGYLLVVVIIVILAMLVLVTLSAALVLLGSVLGVLFALTTFEGALLTTLVALGVLLAFVLGSVGRIGEEMSDGLASRQEDGEDDEEYEDNEDEEDEEAYPPLRLAPERSAGQPISRNAPCPCGSGKKYKRCCLGRDT